MQGGYGKYQGTWIPLQEAKELAIKNGVYEKLRPIFEFVAGERSPPPAPKHATAASSKPRAPRGVPAQRRPNNAAVAAAASNQLYTHHQQSLSQSQSQQHQDYEALDTQSQLDPQTTPSHSTTASSPRFTPADPHEMQPPSTRKRRRPRDDSPSTLALKSHRLWADDLLDYFMLSSELQSSPPPLPPSPPPGTDLNRPIDERGHTALHWAAAMGSVPIVRDLIRRGADVDVQSSTGETPLMRSVIFTNAWDKKCMEPLAVQLVRTVTMQEWHSNSTVFHLICALTSSKKKYECARYYLDCLLNKMSEVMTSDQIERVLNETDAAGDTAITIAARNGARKCVRSLIGRNAAVDIPNAAGETADQLIVQLNCRRQEREIGGGRLSSSPYQPTNSMASGLMEGGPVMPLPFTPMAADGANGTVYTDGTFESTSALSLQTQLLPTLQTKTHALAEKLEMEIREKDSELAEAERVAHLRREEIAALKAQAQALKQEEEEWEGDDVLADELQALEAECETFTKTEGDQALKALMAFEARKSLGTPESSSGGSTNGEEALLKERLELAREVYALHEERKGLVRGVVQCLASLGASAGGETGAGAAEEKRRLYRRLIVGALSVREEDVEGLLPEILEELEGDRATGA